MDIPFPSPRGDKENLGKMSANYHPQGFRPLAGIKKIPRPVKYIGLIDGCFRPLAGIKKICSGGA